MVTETLDSPPELGYCEPMREKIRVQVQSMLPGDVTSGSGFTVVSVHPDVYNSRKTIVYGHFADGEPRARHWGRTNIITVTREV